MLNDTMTRCSTLSKRVGIHTTRPGGTSGHLKWFSCQEDLGLTVQRNRQQSQDSPTPLLQKLVSELESLHLDVLELLKSCISKVALGPRFYRHSMDSLPSRTPLKRGSMKRAVMHQVLRD